MKEAEGTQRRKMTFQGSYDKSVARLSLELRALSLQGAPCCFPTDTETPPTLTSSHACISDAQEILNSVSSSPSPVSPDVKWGLVLHWGWRWGCKMGHRQGKPTKAFSPTALSWQSDQESLSVLPEDRRLVFSCCQCRTFSPFLVTETSLPPF